MNRELVDDDPDLGEPDQCSGNPIATATGNKFEHELDHASNTLPLIRYFNSQAGSDLGLGFGWRHGYSGRIVHMKTTLPVEVWSFPGPPGTRTQMAADTQLDWATYQQLQPERFSSYDDYFVLERANGKRWSFKVWGYGPATPRADNSLRQYQVSFNANGFRVVDGANIEFYDNDGRLISIETPANTITLSYFTSSKMLKQVSDRYGNSIQFKYDTNGRISAATTNGGATLQYAYDAVGHLVSVTHPDQTSRQYHYEDPNPYLLTGITDEAGVRYATWRYNADGEAISSEHVGGIDKVSLAFTQAGSTRTTTETDPLGTVRRYHFTQIGKRWLLTGQDQPGGAGCGPASATLGYDANGNVQSRTDFNGVSTTYGYDLTRNLETTRTEAAGTPQARTVTTTWHPTFRLPATLTEPGRVTTFSYDDQGHLLQKQITADGVTRAWRWTYLPNGLLETATDPLGQLTRYSYDAQGNLATVTNPLNQVTRYPRYDAHGNLLEQIDPDNRSTTFSYDLRQRLKSRTEVHGTTTFDYLPTGLLSRVTLPDGSGLSYRYDPAHRLVGLDHSSGSKVEYTLDAAGNRTREDRIDPSGALAAGQQAVTAAQALPTAPTAH
ncbi:DUF6531 domain-containing protein [Chitiniphilus purpureus]|uniref:DUF6531 domain-containing protein n=1 Tax=Chitiniphilus purpureus TaxID=2981137 RepID=A0ABY6DQU7_9NEIS|nr:DUF6531 domain-containing protein [Chitiniphilus sp. CD1]UXY16754.1 DUF6531 domain-containing protein [Chitiniphilus sp. CD1]